MTPRRGFLRFRLKICASWAELGGVGQKILDWLLRAIALRDAFPVRSRGGSIKARICKTRYASIFFLCLSATFK